MTTSFENLRVWRLRQKINETKRQLGNLRKSRK